MNVGGYLVIDLEHHVGELQHGVPLDLCQGDDVVEVVQQLVGGLSHAAQVLAGLKLRTYLYLCFCVSVRNSVCTRIQEESSRKQEVAS